MNVGSHGRAESLYNLHSRRDVFGLSPEEARAQVDSMLAVVSQWRQRFAAQSIEKQTLEMLDGAVLSVPFPLTKPPERV